MPTNPAEPLGGRPWWLEGGLAATGHPAEIITFGSPPAPPPAPPPVPAGGGQALVLPSANATLIQILGAQYGIDVLCLVDLDPNLSLTQNALIQDIWHLISEAPGTIFWSPSQTISLRNLLSKGVTAADIANTQAMVQAIISADERVAQCQCTITQVDPEMLSANIVVFPEQGSAFNLVVSISKVTITLISVGLVNL